MCVVNVCATPPASPALGSGCVPFTLLIKGASHAPVIGGAGTGGGLWGMKRRRIWGRWVSVQFLTEGKMEEAQRGVTTTTGSPRPPQGLDDIPSTPICLPCEPASPHRSTRGIGCGGQFGGHQG